MTTRANPADVIQDELREVTQADRDAASALVNWHNACAKEWAVDGGATLQFFTDAMPGEILTGVWDNHPTVQAFARHRLAALQAAQHRQEDVAGMREDTRLLDMLRDECWDLRCFDVPTGGDDYETNWRVIGHWQAEPRERVIAEGYSDDPRVALRAALDRNQLTGEKDG